VSAKDRAGKPCTALQVVLSTAGTAEGSGFSLGAFMGGDDAALRSPAREAAVSESGVPHTIVRAGAHSRRCMYAHPLAEAEPQEVRAITVRSGCS